MARSEVPPLDWSPRVRRVLSAIAASAVSSQHVTVSQQVPVTQQDSLCRYLDLVSTWNDRYDLTAARDADELVDLFVADAMLIAVHTPVGAVQCVDVGSGAGAPGLPLALLRPDLRLTLVEPRTKRVAFLRTVVGSLPLAGVAVRRARDIELAEQSFDVAISRATLPPEEWLRAGARIARSAVWLLLAQAEPPPLPGWRVDLDVRYQWPLTGAERRAVRFVNDSEI